MKGIDILYNVDYSIFYMKEYKVKVETRKQFKTLIDADSPQEAQELLLQKILKGEAKMEDDGLITFLEVKEIKE